MARRECDTKAPTIPPRNPFETFLLILSLVASLPLLHGDSGSAALEKSLSDTAVEMWGIALMIGSALALIGLATPNQHRLLGLLLERAGLILTGGAAAIYSAVIYQNAGSVSDVRYSVGIQVAYAIACLWRVVQITKMLRWSKAMAIRTLNHLGRTRGPQ